MALQPRMLQGIELLQLPAGELMEWLEEAARNNEALKVERPQEMARASRGGAEATSRHDHALQNHPAREAGLQEGLYEQLLKVEGTAAQGFQKLQLLYDAYKTDGEEKIALVQPSLDLARDVMASLDPITKNATGEL